MSKASGPKKFMMGDISIFIHHHIQNFLVYKEYVAVKGLIYVQVMNAHFMSVKKGETLHISQIGNWEKNATCAATNHHELSVKQ